MKQKITTLIPDIHKLLTDGKEGFSEKNIQEFFQALRGDIEEFLSPETRDNKGRLRMSAIGKHDRQLWYEFNDKKKRPISAQLKLRFFFGNLVESFILFLVQESGHKVTDRQKEVVIDSIKGHMDAKIDGVVVDVKSASDFGFKKFKEHTLFTDDPFGYVGQLSGYVQAEGGDTGYFLAYNKSTAELCLLELDALTMIDAKKRIADLKKIMNQSDIPEKCYTDKPDGKSGNRVIDTNCTFCDYRYGCWSDANDGEGLRVFSYSRVPKYFSHIEREPSVEELLM
jgi:hypothetical protein